MGVEKGEGESAVCASSTQTRSRRQDFNKVKVHRGNGVALGQERIGSADEVVAWIAFYGVAVEVQKAAFSRARAHQFESVTPGDGQEEAVQIVESIGTLAPNLKPKIHLGVGKGDL